MRFSRQFCKYMAGIISVKVGAGGEGSAQVETKEPGSILPPPEETPFSSLP